MHLKRWITSIVVLPFLILLIYKGSQVLFAVFIGIVCILCLWEYYRIVFQTRTIAKEIPLLSYITGPVIIWAAHSHKLEIIVGAVACNLLIAGLLSLPRFKSNASVVDVVAKQMVSMIYIPLFLSCLLMIRNGTDGVQWIFLLLIVIFAGDIGAYYIGRNFGRHKLCPAVSPGKTIEGAIGGLISNLIVGAIYKHFFLPVLPWRIGIPLFLLIGAVGIVGDLFESELKRVANIKDSGTILPGHGGMLDRIDALLFAAPVVYVFKVIILNV